MSKKTLMVLAVSLALGLNVSLAYAKNSATQDIPDQNGTYDVPGHPNLKVRVFVHNPKPQNAKNQLGTCSLTDPNEGPQVDPAGWHLPSSWNYYLNTSSAPLGAVRTNLTNYSGQAFSKWADAIGSNKVTFSLKGYTTIAKKAYDGKNIIAWGTAPGTALAVTYTWYYTQSKEAVETDTIMNKKFSWSWMPYSLTNCPSLQSYDAQDILTHELGHWVGLDDEYNTSYAYNTMYGYGAKGEIIKDTLTTGDSTGAYNIYK